MKKNKSHSALHEQEGIPQPESINTSGVDFFKKSRKKSVDLSQIIKEIRVGNITALSQAITTIESTNPAHQKLASEIIQGCISKNNNTIRVGITGVPGVGKSTFIEALGKHLTEKGKKVAVLAVDPSSSISKGSILGDKTRMEELVKDSNAYIRPSASGTTLGGVARKTREAMILCEAAGFDVVLVETVGVGQSETAVHSMVDCFLLLKITGAGDSLQGIKRGIMEMADIVVINKADGKNVTAAKLAKTEFKRALHLFPEKSSGWTPEVTTCSALEKIGVDEVWQLIENYVKTVTENSFFEENRKNQNLFWMMETIEDQLKTRFINHPKIEQEIDKYKIKVKREEISPFAAAMELIELYITN